MIKFLSAIILAVSLTGCSSFLTKPEALANRVSCTAAKDKGFINSMWGWIGISSEIDEKDTKEICK